jgi:segregation and condensation protein A
LERSPSSEDGFRVNLANFDGPFDLLISLISKHEMDITEVSLAAVTGEFIAFLRDLDGTAELDAASEFLVVAATLLDMKIVGLLPAGEYADADDVAVLEARDMLFARLLQYRAFKEISVWFAQRIERESARHPRAVRLEDKFRERTPELVWTTSIEDFHTLALYALAPREIPFVGLEHLHAPLVSVREQAAIVITMIRSAPMTFRQIIAGADQRGVIVARFLAILELYRQSAVAFEQIEPLGELTVRWSAETWNDENLVTLGAEYGN